MATHPESLAHLAVELRDETETIVILISNKYFEFDSNNVACSAQRTRQKKIRPKFFYGTFQAFCLCFGVTPMIKGICRRFVDE